MEVKGNGGFTVEPERQPEGQHGPTGPDQQQAAPLVARRPGFLGVPSRLELDEATGFLQSPRHDGITGLMKTDILELYRKSGNLTSACRITGIEPRLIRWHMANDPAFKQAIAEAREEISDKAEGHIVEWMGSQKNVIDRLAWLRAHRPDRWNPKAEVSVTHNTEVTVKLAAKAREALETTVVDPPPGIGQGT